MLQPSPNDGPLAIYLIACWAVGVLCMLVAGTCWQFMPIALGTAMLLLAANTITGGDRH